MLYLFPPTDFRSSIRDLHALTKNVAFRLATPKFKEHGKRVETLVEALT